MMPQMPHTAAWKTFTLVSFTAAAAMLAIGIFFLPADIWIKGYLAMAALFPHRHDLHPGQDPARRARGEPADQQDRGRRRRAGAARGRAGPAVTAAPALSQAVAARNAATASENSGVRR